MRSSRRTDGFGVKLVQPFYFALDNSDPDSTRADDTRKQALENITNTDAFVRDSLDQVAQQEIDAAAEIGFSNFSLGTCSADSDCNAPPVRAALAALLAPRLANDLAAARTVVAATHPESYFCSAGDPAKGQSLGCYWHPYLKRLHVTPSAIEAVWYDVGEPAPADLQIVKLLDPDDAPNCSTFGEEKKARQVPITNIPE